MKKLFSIIFAFFLILTLSVSAFARSFMIDFGGFPLILEANTRSDLARRAFELTNKNRTDNDLEPMIWDDSLASPAMQRAVEASVSDDHYNYQHMRPNGELWSTAAPDAGAENLLYGAFATPQSAAAEWMSDTEYSDNILNPDFTSVAIGCVEISPDAFYWVQLFGDKTDSDPPNYYIVTFDDGCGSGISDQMIPEGGKVVKPVDPFKAGHTVEGWFKDLDFSAPWDFDTDTVDSDIVLYAKWVFIGYDTSDPGTAKGEDDEFLGGGTSSNRIIGGSSGGSSSGGGSGGGGGGGGGSFGGISPLTASKPATSSNVGANGTVSASSIKAEAEKALTNNAPSVKTKNAASISASTMKALADLATKRGKTLTLIADTTFSDNIAIQGRIYIPVGSIDAKDDLKLGVYTDSENTKPVRTRFEKAYNNTFAAVRLIHEGEFGGRVKVAAKVELKGLNTGGLLVYSYDKEKNTYIQIPGAAHSLDKNGYLHFYTDKGGDIIITDTVLSKKTAIK